MELDYLIHQYLYYHLGTNLILFILLLLFIKRYMKTFKLSKINRSNFADTLNDISRFLIFGSFILVDILQPFEYVFLETFYFLFSFGIVIAILTINFRK